MKCCWLRDYAIDIMNGWAILLSCGVAAGLLFSLIWIGALRNYAKAVIWISMLLVNVVSLAYALFCYFKAGIIKYKGAAIGQQFVDKFKGAPAGLDFTAITGRHFFQWYGNVMIGVSVALVLLSVITLSRLKNWIEVTVKCLEVCSEAIDAIQPIHVTQAVVYTQINTMQQATSPHIPNTVQPQAIPTPHQIAHRGGQEVQTPKFMTQVVQPIRPSSLSLLWERLQAPFFRPLLLVTMPILCITIACWLTVLFFIISICNIRTQSDGTYAFVWTWRFYVLVAYHSFGLAWAWQFINGLNDIVIAGSISYYYWHRYTVFAPVVQVLVSTLRYNSGSAIFGGLFFAPALLFLRNICRSINKLVQSLEQLGKQVPEHVTSGVDRTLSCMENVISYFNKNALILVAIKGKDYCQSASLARDRLHSNALLVDTFSVSPDRLLIIGKILVCFSCAICALAMSVLPVYSDTSSSSCITSPIFLILMTTVIAYTMAHTLLQVHKTTWDTLILNLCEDCERTHGRPRYPPASLLQLAQMKLEMKAAKQKKQQEQATKAESDMEKAVDEQ